MRLLPIVLIVTLGVTPLTAQGIGGGYGGGSFPHAKGQFMGRFAIRRHRDGINVGFVDGHAARVPAKGLWTLNWHQGFQPNYNVKLP